VRRISLLESAGEACDLLLVLPDLPRLGLGPLARVQRKFSIPPATVITAATTPIISTKRHIRFVAGRFLFFSNQKKISGKFPKCGKMMIFFVLSLYSKYDQTESRDFRASGG